MLTWESHQTLDTAVDLLAIIPVTVCHVQHTNTQIAKVQNFNGVLAIAK